MTKKNPEYFSKNLFRPLYDFEEVTDRMKGGIWTSQVFLPVSQVMWSTKMPTSALAERGEFRRQKTFIFSFQRQKRDETARLTLSKSSGK